MSRDLMRSAEVKELVRDAYRHVPATTAAVAHKLYSAEELTGVPASAVNRALGVANHLRYADSTSSANWRRPASTPSRSSAASR